MTNPDEGHICEGEQKPVAVAEQVLNQSKEQISRNGKRPRVEYREVLADVVQQYGE